VRDHSKRATEPLIAYYARQVDDQHLKLWVTIEHTRADHPGAVDGRVEGSANRMSASCPTDSNRWMDVHHDAIRRRKLPQPFRLGAVEGNAFRGVAVAGRNRLGAAWLIISSTIGLQPSSSACALAISANSPG
jgi:hypothetical protein